MENQVNQSENELTETQENLNLELNDEVSNLQENQDTLNAETLEANEQGLENQEEIMVSEDNQDDISESENVKLEEVQSQESEEIEEKPKSRFKIFFENLNYKLSYTPALGFVGIMCVVCFLGFLFFLNERKLFAGNEQIVGSCLLFQIFFGVACALFLVLFISSIVLNLIRRKQGKR